MDNTQLIEKLKEIQQTQGLTDGQMAKRLGCTRQLYQMTRTNKAPVGLTILRGAAKAFPEIIGDAIYFLTSDADMRAVTTDIRTMPPEKPYNKNLGAYLRNQYQWLIKIIKG